MSSFGTQPTPSATRSRVSKRCTRYSSAYLAFLPVRPLAVVHRSFSLAGRRLEGLMIPQAFLFMCLARMCTRKS